MLGRWWKEAYTLTFAFTLKSTHIALHSSSSSSSSSIRDHLVLELVFTWAAAAVATGGKCARLSFFMIIDRYPSEGAFDQSRLTHTSRCTRGCIYKRAHVCPLSSCSMMLLHPSPSHIRLSPCFAPSFRCSSSPAGSASASSPRLGQASSPAPTHGE